MVRVAEILVILVALEHLWSVFAQPLELAAALKVFFLCCVIVAGVGGAVTVSYRILLVQSLPAALALLTVLLSRA